jgi:hypothetical protein
MAENTKLSKKDCDILFERFDGKLLTAAYIPKSAPRKQRIINQVYDILAAKSGEGGLK